MQNQMCGMQDHIFFSTHFQRKFWCKSNGDFPQPETENGKRKRKRQNFAVTTVGGKGKPEPPPAPP